jgi:hypothetical protein
MAEERKNDHTEHGTWAVDDSPPVSAHDVAVEAAKEAARAHFINSRINGTPTPDLDSWPPVYVEAFLTELARLSAAAMGRGEEGGPS